MAKIPASKKDEFYENRRADLANAAVRLWSEHGIEATSVAKIAEAAGIAKGTFYLYFDSKNALLDEVLRRYTLLPRIEEMADAIAATSFEEAVAAFVRAAWRHLHAHRDLVLLAAREMPAHLDRTQHTIETVLVPGNKMLAAYLERHLPPARAERLSLIVASRSLVGMIVMMFLTQEILGAHRYLPLSEEEITQTIARVFLHGVLGSPEEP